MKKFNRIISVFMATLLMTSCMIDYLTQPVMANVNEEQEKNTVYPSFESIDGSIMKIILI